MKSNSLWGMFLLLSFVITLPFTWVGLTKVNFFYSVLHDTIGIDKHIEHYAPQNLLNKLDFEKTTKAQRVSLFESVVTAIHNNGEGLAELAYTNANQQQVRLFTQGEIGHLTDVANLLNKLKPIAFMLVFVWCVAFFVMFYKQLSLPSLKQNLLMALFWISLVSLVLLAGPEKIFNQLHIWAFPGENPWLFYYEESLMAVLMKAPHIFSYIVVIWVALSMLLTVMLLLVMNLGLTANLKKLL